MTLLNCARPIFNDPADSFYLFRCRAGCFHLVWRGSMVLHFTPPQLRMAVEALNSLWHKPLEPHPLGKGDSLFRAYRCSSGHCHLISHGLVDLRLSEKAARSLREEMLAAEQTLDNGEPLCLAVDYVM